MRQRRRSAMAIWSPAAASAVSASWRMMASPAYRYDDARYGYDRAPIYYEDDYRWYGYRSPSDRYDDEDWRNRRRD